MTLANGILILVITDMILLFAINMCNLNNDKRFKYLALGMFALVVVLFIILTIQELDFIRWLLS